MDKGQEEERASDAGWPAVHHYLRGHPSPKVEREGWCEANESR